MQYLEYWFNPNLNFDSIFLGQSAREQSRDHVSLHLERLPFEIWMEFSVIPGRMQMDGSSRRKVRGRKGCRPRFSWLSASPLDALSRAWLTEEKKRDGAQSSQLQAPHGNTSRRKRMLKTWKMAADFLNVYRCNGCLCSSVVLADVLEHNCNPAGENELSFMFGTCVFLLLAWFGLPMCFRLSYVEGK